ncbi:MAG: hypothetical protein ACREDS_12245 [Limisphaerales bacterium]
MKTTIDMKSILLGGAIGILAIFAIGASDSTNTNGRYQVAVGNSQNGHGFAIMVDTETGKAWGADIQSDWKSGGFWDQK